MTLMSDVVALVDDITFDLGMQAQGAKRVTLKKFTGDAGTGAKSWDAGKKYSAVVEKKQQMVRGEGGEMVASHTTVTFLKPTVVAEPKDMIVLPGETAGYEIMAVSGPIDASGQLIRECYLG